MKNLLMILAISQIFSMSSIVAQEAEMYEEKEFVIIKSTKNFQEAQETAIEASNNLGVKFDFRDLEETPDSLGDGLTWPVENCSENDWEYPCYVARGRSDDGFYTSVEYSSAYTGFAEGYYIVIVCSEKKGSIKVDHALKLSKQFYKDAYSKSSKVYVGCMH